MAWGTINYYLPRIISWAFTNLLQESMADTPPHYSWRHSYLWWLNLHCQVDRAYSQPGDTPLHMCLRAFSERLTSSDWGQHHPIGWDLGLNRKEGCKEQAKHQHSSAFADSVWTAASHSQSWVIQLEWTVALFRLGAQMYFLNYCLLNNFLCVFV